MDCEAIAVSVANQIRQQESGGYYLFSLYPDSLYAAIFPGILPAASRYRCCVLFLTEVGLPEVDRPKFDSPVTESALLDLSSILWPSQEYDKKRLQPIPLHLPTRNARLSDFFFQLCQAIDLAPIQGLLRMGSHLLPPGSSESTSLDLIFSQLTDDMFSGGLPSVESTSVSKLRAFQAFGCLMAVLILNGEALPIQVNKEVLEFAFGLTDECAAELKGQMSAIRAGVYKVEMAKPVLKRIVRRQAFCSRVKIGPCVAVERVEQSDFCGFLLDHCMILPFIRAKLSEGGHRDAVSPVEVQFVDELRIDYDSGRNTIVLPSCEAWIRMFGNEVAV
jgi:hypothetical protein